MAPSHDHNDPTEESVRSQLGAPAAFTLVMRARPNAAVRRGGASPMLRIAPLLAVCLLTFAPALGRAQHTERQHMTLLMEDYFGGEKSQAYVFLGAGLAAFGTSAFLFTRPDDLAHGAAYPVLVVGVLEATAGTVLLAATGGRVAERKRQIESDPAGFKSAEQARMEGVMKQFSWIEYIEIASALTGLGLYTYGEVGKRPVVAGVGIGLALQSTVMLGLDFLADRRGQRYVNALSGFNPHISREAYGLSWRGRF